MGTTGLSVISGAASIAANTTTLITALETHYDTRTLKKAANQLGYSIQTIGNGRQLMDMMGFEGRDRERAEALMDAFTIKARNEILKTIR